MWGAPAPGEDPSGPWLGVVMVVVVGPRPGVGGRSPEPHIFPVH